MILYDAGGFGVKFVQSSWSDVGRHENSILLSILIGSPLRVITKTLQHIKDITFLQINCMICGQMFVDVGCILSLL